MLFPLIGWFHAISIEVCKIKGDCVVNHDCFFFFFWKDMWMGVVHHICGEHEWLQGECSHGPLTCQEEGKTCLQKDSKAHQAVRDIVFDKEWLRSLVFYVLFR